MSSLWVKCISLYILLLHILAHQRCLKRNRRQSTSYFRTLYHLSSFLVSMSCVCTEKSYECACRQETKIGTKTNQAADANISKTKRCCYITIHTFCWKLEQTAATHVLLLTHTQLLVIIYEKLERCCWMI